MIKKLIVILTIFTSFAIANNSLESKIVKLQTVPKDQRYKLMNQIKRELAKMNATQRAKALNRLKESIHSSNGNMHTHMQHGTKDMGSHMQNSTKHMLNETHIHEHNNKPKKPHKSTEHSTPKRPDNHKKPGEHKNPGHQKGSYVK